jgi:Flp pilus assembly pilin Flp
MSDRVLELAARFRKEQGQALAEYSLILAFVAAACVLALGILGLALAGHLDALTAAFP